MIPADYMILLQVMRHGFTTHKSTNASLISEDESSTIVAHQGRLQPKTLFSIFFKSIRSAFIHAVDKDKTMDHNYYIENCPNSVVKEIRKQRNSSGTKAIKLFYHNARSHIYPDVIHYLTKEDIIIMLRLPYSTDLAPCDYWLNNYIKRNSTD